MGRRSKNRARGHWARAAPRWNRARTTHPAVCRVVGRGQGGWTESCVIVLWVSAGAWLVSPFWSWRLSHSHLDSLQRGLAAHRCTVQVPWSFARSPSAGFPAARAGPTSETLAAAHREPVRAPSTAPSANQRWGWRLSGALTPAGGSVCMAYRWYVGTLHAVGGRWSTTGPARSGGVCTMVLHHGMMGPSGRVPSWPPREPPPRGALRSRSRLSRRRVPARDGGI